MLNIEYGGVERVDLSERGGHRGAHGSHQPQPLGSAAIVVVHAVIAMVSSDNCREQERLQSIMVMNTSPTIPGAKKPFAGKQMVNPTYVVSLSVQTWSL